MSSAPYIIVSGGSGDIGRETCLLLAQNGYRPLVGYAHNKAAAEDIADEINGVAVKIDLTDLCNIEQSVDDFVAQYKDIRGVVVAGSPPPALARFTDIDEQDMKQQWDVNVLGTQVLLARCIKKIFKPQKSGCVVAVLTAAMGGEGEHAMKQMGAYVIAKYGMLGVLKLLEAEYSWLSISTIYPGFTRTKMLEAFDPRFLEMMEAQSPFSTPQDIARKIVDEILKEDT